MKETIDRISGLMMAHGQPIANTPRMLSPDRTCRYFNEADQLCMAVRKATSEYDFERVQVDTTRLLILGICFAVESGFPLAQLFDQVCDHSAANADQLDFFMPADPRTDHV